MPDFLIVILSQLKMRLLPVLNESPEAHHTPNLGFQTCRR